MIVRGIRDSRNARANIRFGTCNRAGMERHAIGYARIHVYVREARNCQSRQFHIVPCRRLLTRDGVTFVASVRWLTRESIGGAVRNESISQFMCAILFLKSRAGVTIVTVVLREGSFRRWGEGGGGIVEDRVSRAVLSREISRNSDWFQEASQDCRAVIYETEPLRITSRRNNDNRNAIAFGCANCLLKCTGPSLPRGENVFCTYVVTVARSYCVDMR